MMKIYRVSKGLFDDRVCNTDIGVDLCELIGCLSTNKQYIYTLYLDCSNNA